jgi:hypothetical protein
MASNDLQSIGSEICSGKRPEPVVDFCKTAPSVHHEFVVVHSILECIPALSRYRSPFSSREKSESESASRLASSESDGDPGGSANKDCLMAVPERGCCDRSADGGAPGGGPRYPTCCGEFGITPVDSPICLYMKSGAYISRRCSSIYRFYHATNVVLYVRQ